MPVWFIIVVILELLWLLIESKWLTIQLKRI
jgi:hypothetical protein